MIPLHKVFMPDGINPELNHVLHSGQIAYGEYTKRFEARVAEYIGNQLFLSIAGNSMFFALSVLGIKQDDEIIASPMSCLMSTQPLAVLGAKVVWADIDPATGTIDPSDVQRKITSKTKAIIHYHWGGYPGYIDEINAIGNSAGIFVIEEASMAFGSIYKGKKIGNTNSDIVCFSFSAVRLPNALDGAGLSFNCEKLFEKAKKYRDLGVDRSTFRNQIGEISDLSDVSEPGISAMLNNVSGFIGLQQMEHIVELHDQQRQNSKAWKNSLRKKSGIRFLDERSEIRPNYWVFGILVNSNDEWLTMFRNRGFWASKLHLRNDEYSVFRNCEYRGELKGVNEFSLIQLNIPCGWWITSKEIACLKI